MLGVGTGDTFLAAPRASMAVGLVRFSRTVYQWVPVFVHVGVRGRKTECVTVRARLAERSGSLISAKAPFLRHGASLRLRVMATRNFFLWPSGCHHQIRFVVNLLSHSSLLPKKCHVQFNWSNFSPVLIFAAPLFFPFFFNVKCFFVALKNLDPKPRISKDALRFIKESMRRLDQAGLRPWPFSARRRGS